MKIYYFLTVLIFCGINAFALPPAASEQDIIKALKRNNKKEVEKLLAVPIEWNAVIEQPGNNTLLHLLAQGKIAFSENLLNELMKSESFEEYSLRRNKEGKTAWDIIIDRISTYDEAENARIPNNRGFIFLCATLLVQTPKPFHKQIDLFLRNYVKPTNNKKDHFTKRSIKRKAAAVFHEKLEIIEEGEGYAIFNKPPGVAIVGTHDSVISQAAQQYEHCSLLSLQDIGWEKDYEPGVLHRLDAATTGVVCVALNPLTQTTLMPFFREKTKATEKIYYAVVCGRPEEAMQHTAPSEIN